MKIWNGFTEIPAIRKLFVVPLADNNSGKSRIVRSIIRLGNAVHADKDRMSTPLTTFSGQRVSALVFPSSYQEMKRREGKRLGKTKVVEYLCDLDPEWFTYDLIILPSHDGTKHVSDPQDLQEMIELGQQHGYGMIAVSVTRDDRKLTACHRGCLGLDWDERWVARNFHMRKFCEMPDDKFSPLTQRAQFQIDNIAGHLWTRIQRTMLP